MNFLVRPRKSWGARLPKSVHAQHFSDIHTLVVHHTAGKAPVTLSAAKREMRSIQRQHMDANGWSDIGYNFVIDRWGRAWEGRGYYAIGAHTLRQNSGTIGISFMGNYEEKKLTKRQIQAYYKLRARMADKGIKPSKVKGHRQMPRQATACPGKNIIKQLGL